MSKQGGAKVHFDITEDQADCLKASLQCLITLKELSDILPPKLDKYTSNDPDDDEEFSKLNTIVLKLLEIKMICEEL